MNTFGVTESRAARRSARGILTAASAALIALSLAGCTTPVEGGNATSEPTTTPGVTTAAPAAEPLVIPTCEQMLPESIALEYLGADGELLPTEGDEGPEEVPWALYAQGFDPLLDAVAQRNECIWGFSDDFHSFFTIMVADTSSLDIAALEAQIDVAGYESTPNGDVETYVLQEETSDGYDYPTIAVVNDLWLFAELTEPEDSLRVLNAMLDEVRTLNPTRGY
ncbi:hypothetical protein ESZ53_08980 [Salinibacterium sp. UTAS2018]|uniref:hypothetical protein n=1 Tax=Salinibacterium sp. UTAS2018 TaxID=2508880 RepID=UPI0010094C08|nr:hypothetical protein [Salinibacterium sp. UTAS2018]QAV70559.1 hypothetical protein ESZ53_08980 [Salinibacterium sp. UTAS2018]